MKEIELVIKIPEEKLSIIKNKMYCGIYDPDLYKAVADGTPLPEGCDIQRIIPKRVDIQKWMPTVCPNCERELSTHHGDGYYFIEDTPSFCPKCGQAFLWKSEE